MNLIILLVLTINYGKVFSFVIRNGIFDYNNGDYNGDYNTGYYAPISKADEFPYQVMLIGSTYNGKFLCGGTLLDSEWILTAAHCVQNVLSLEVHLGARSFDDFDESGRVIQKTTKYIIHEKFNPRFAQNDVALVKLVQKVKYSNRIQPVRLPVIKENFEGQVAVASGWGSNQPRKSAEQLQSTDFKVISNKECTKSFSKLIVQDSVVCAEGLRFDNVCAGDSGGPLVLKGTKILIGITSFGHKNGCKFGSLGGFSRITTYLDWIKSKTGIRP